MRAVRGSPTAARKADVSLRRMLQPLGLTQFALFGLIGLAAAMFLPANPVRRQP